MLYTLKLVIVSIVAAVGIYFWNRFLPGEYTNMHAYFVLPFFVIYSFLSYQSLSKSLDSENKNAFTVRFMASTGLKLFACLIVIVVYGFLNKAQIVSFAVLFLFMYFVFTSLETIALFKEIQNRKKQSIKQI